MTQRLVIESALERLRNAAPWEQWSKELEVFQELVKPYKEGGRPGAVVPFLPQVEADLPISGSKRSGVYPALKLLLFQGFPYPGQLPQAGQLGNRLYHVGADDLPSFIINHRDTWYLKLAWRSDGR